VRCISVAIAASVSGCALVVQLDSLGPSDAGGAGDSAPGDTSAPPDAVVTPDGDAAVTYPAVILADDPLAYYPLDEPNGTTAHDATGHGHDGTIVKGVLLGRPGAFAGSNTSARFDGNGSFIKVDDSVRDAGTAFDFVGASSFTFEAWVRIEAVATTNTAFTFFSKEASPSSNVFLGWDFFDGPNLRLQREDNPVNETEADSQNGLAANTWFYLVGTYDGNTILVYVDTNVVATFSGSTTSLPITQVPFLLGAEDAVGDSSLLGQMDEVAVYAKALTPAQIATHFHAGGR
jgi:hypothetical protein